MIIKNLYRPIINCQDYIHILQDGSKNIIITVSVKDFNDEYVTGKSLPVHIITPNGTKSVIHEGVGENPVDYNINYTVSDYGLYTIDCDGVKKQFYVNGLKFYSINSSIYLFYTETKAMLVISGTINSSKGGWLHIATIPNSLSKYRPKQGVFYCSGGYSGGNTKRKGDYQIVPDGKIYYRNWDGSGNVNEQTQISWSI